METYDYSNSDTKSLSRPLTPQEKRELIKARRAWTPKASTPQQLQINDDVRTLIARLYEDGASRKEIATVTGWSVPSIAQKVRAAVANGTATGRRVYRPHIKPVKEPAPPTSRPLTPREAEWLTKNAARMPRTARGYYRWDNDLGDKIAGKIAQWIKDTPPASHESIGEALGMSRQAVAVLIDRHITRKPHREPTRPEGLTEQQFSDLVTAAHAARPWGTRRIRWASTASAPLIRVLGNLYLDGVPVTVLAEALHLEPNSIRNGLNKSGIVLRDEDVPKDGYTKKTVLHVPSRTATRGRTVSKKTGTGKPAAVKPKKVTVREATAAASR